MNFRSRSLFSAAVALLLAFVAGCGSGDDAPPPPSGCVGSCKTFVTALNFTGNLGGVSGADTLCSNDTNKPLDGATYKAMLVDNTRVACTTANCGGGLGEHTDWVLKPNTSYYRDDGTTLIGVTNSSGLFTTPLISSYAAAGVESHRLWTGFEGDWTTDDSRNCTNWTVADSLTPGRHARRDSTDSQAIAYLWQNCSDLNNALLCVEQ